MVWVFMIATGLVALAELGDKTQMLTLVLAARYKPRQVLLGVFLAVLALQAVAVAAGGLVGTLLPASVVGVVAGFLFIGFGLWSLRRATDEDDGESPSAGGRFGPVVGVAGAFFLAELGDKTQLMTMSIAADPGAAARSVGFLGGAFPAIETGPLTYVAVWLGSTLGMMLVNGLAVALGAALGSRISPRTIARISGVVFIAFGVLSIASALLGG